MCIPRSAAELPAFTGPHHRMDHNVKQGKRWETRTNPEDNKPRGGREPTGIMSATMVS